jgi:hypothetical protein
MLATKCLNPEPDAMLPIPKVRAQTSGAFNLVFCVCCEPGHLESPCRSPPHFVICFGEHTSGVGALFPRTERQLRISIEGRCLLYECPKKVPWKQT